ncbi:CesT family type III secretion system chaperone [Marinomonas balearica]|uniref:Tir chaperone family protein CesT n=1 Tax=Marinomonas balearica TaxID=491947 RepID=A0A4R6M8X5_9GAMM|nr:CesT family type III secretion system chaperone [Marinomonas balearica]TDO97948.1 Tir chaperone family protein CesT [Marinomonas balearica]
MHAKDARTWLFNSLKTRTLISGKSTEDFFDQYGQAHYSLSCGQVCLFSIPDHNAKWHIYTLLRELDPQKDGQYLSLALALNLECLASSQARIGLNLESNQLLLQTVEELNNPSLDPDSVLTTFSYLYDKVMYELSSLDLSLDKANQVETLRANNSSYHAFQLQQSIEGIR